MKRQTIKFYANGVTYMGWKYVDKTTYREVMNWIRSGNSVVIGKQWYSWINRPSLILNKTIMRLLK